MKPADVTRGLVEAVRGHLDDLDSLNQMARLVRALPPDQPGDVQRAEREFMDAARRHIAAAGYSLPITAAERTRDGRTWDPVVASYRALLAAEQAEAARPVEVTEGMVTAGCREMRDVSTFDPHRVVVRKMLEAALAEREKGGSDAE